MKLLTSKPEILDTVKELTLEEQQLVEQIIDKTSSVRWFQSPKGNLVTFSKDLVAYKGVSNNNFRSVFVPYLLNQRVNVRADAENPPSNSDVLAQKEIFYLDTDKKINSLIKFLEKEGEYETAKEVSKHLGNSLYLVGWKGCYSYMCFGRGVLVEEWKDLGAASIEQVAQTSNQLSIDIDEEDQDLLITQNMLSNLAATRRQSRLAEAIATQANSKADKNTQKIKVVESSLAESTQNQAIINQTYYTKIQELEAEVKSINERVSIRTFCTKSNLIIASSANTILRKAVTHACNLSDEITLYKQDGLYQYPFSILKTTLNTLINLGILHKVKDVRSSEDRIFSSKDLEKVSRHTPTPKGNLFNGVEVTKSILSSKCRKLGLLIENTRQPNLKVKPKSSFEGYVFLYNYFKKAYNFDPMLAKKLFGIKTPGCQIILNKKHGAEAVRILDDKIAELKN